MNDPDPQHVTAPDHGRAPAVSRVRVIATGAAALLVCAAIIATATWWLLRPTTPTPDDRSTTTTTTTPTPAAPEGTADHDSADAGGDGGGHPYRHGAGAITGTPYGTAPQIDDITLAQTWVATLLGWTPDERDASAAAARAAALAPQADVQQLAGNVLDQAAALAAGGPQPGQLTVVEVTDPNVWPPGWVVLDVTLTTSAAPQAGVPQVVLYVTCEVQVIDGQVVAAVIGDGAAWIEQS